MTICYILLQKKRRADSMDHVHTDTDAWPNRRESTKEGVLRHVLSLQHVLSLKVTKRAAMPARFVTNVVVTNSAGIAPFFPPLGYQYM